MYSNEPDYDLHTTNANDHRALCDCPACVPAGCEGERPSRRVSSREAFRADATMRRKAREHAAARPAPDLSAAATRAAFVGL